MKQSKQNCSFALLMRCCKKRNCRAEGWQQSIINFLMASGHHCCPVTFQKTQHGPAYENDKMLKSLQKQWSHSSSKFNCYYLKHIFYWKCPNWRMGERKISVTTSNVHFSNMWLCTQRHSAANFGIKGFKNCAVWHKNNKNTK